MPQFVRWSIAGLVVMAVGCGMPPQVIDAGVDASVGFDASVVVDSGTPDAGEVSDAGVADSGALDDAGAIDAGADDAGTPDSGTPDAGPEDAGVDAGLDAGQDDAAVDAGPFDAGDPFDAGPNCPQPADAGAPFILRAMAANLTSGNLQSYDPGHGMRIIAGAKPDVVMLQEFNVGANNTASFDAFVNNMFPDAGWSWSRGAGSIPNGVLSRFPIMTQGEWPDALTTTRGFAYAQIDLPGPNNLWVVSVHLLTSNPTNRNTQANALISRLNANIPPNDYVLLGGDLNTDTRDAGTEPCFVTFSQRLVTEGPHPADQNGLTGTNVSRTKPYDQVLPSACLRALQVPTVLGTSFYGWGTVLDTRIYTPLSDLDPAQISDSAAPSMQHMGVVKDFLITP